MRLTPLLRIKKIVSSFIPSELVAVLPRKWEKFGSVVVIKVPEELSAYKQVLGRAYAEGLGCKTVLNDTGGISGEYREPVVEVIYGSSETETIHLEHGIRFKFDPQRIMFSSGNMKERLRMAQIAQADETVVDLFAGIGYFCLPMAVYSKPRKIFACEKNPVAYGYLCQNVVLNHVSRVVEPCLGDNRVVAPRGCAYRVILGYLHAPWDFLQVAFECLKDQVGMLHYHELVPVERIPIQPLARVEKMAEDFNRHVELVQYYTIKSYAPMINHVVLDVRIVV
jgi:tRNA wybutosine-synthesizing protein 2